MTPGQGIEPGTLWWEASAHTTAPTLLPPNIPLKDSLELSVHPMGQFFKIGFTQASYACSFCLSHTPSYFSQCITKNSGRLFKRDWNEISFLSFRDLEAPGQSLNALLMKFARSSTDVTGAKVYNSKKNNWRCCQPDLPCAVNIVAVQTVIQTGNT